MSFTKKLSLFILAVMLSFSFTIADYPSLLTGGDAVHAAQAAKKKKKKKKRKKKKTTEKKVEKSTKKSGRTRRKRRKKKEERQFETLTPEQMAAEDQVRKRKLGEFIESLKVRDNVRGSTKVSIKYDESIEKLLKIIADYPSEVSLRRLAELYWKKGRRLFAEENERYQQAMDDWMNGGQKGKEPKYNGKAGHQYYELAIDVCFKIIELYPEWDGMHEVYLFIGQNYKEMDRKDDAVIYFRKLVKEFPESKYVPDSWFMIGEYYFEKNNVYEALPAYQNAIKFKASQVYGIAKYKIGWCFYNLGDYDKSIDTFKEVVLWSDKMGKKGMTLKEDALKDLVMVFAESGKEQEARKYFGTPDRKKYFRMMLLRLALIYEDQGRTKDAIRLYDEIIADSPLDKNNPKYQMHIVEGWSVIGDKEKTLQAIIKLVDYAKPADESAWVAEIIKTRPDLAQESWETAEGQLIKVVNDYHKEALKTRATQTWDVAESIYNLYLKYFGKDKEGNVNKNYYPVMYNFAELLYERAGDARKVWKKNRSQENLELVRKRFEQAGDQYKAVADYDPKGKFFEDAAYSAIVAFEQIVRTSIDDAIKKAQKAVKQGQKASKVTAKNAEAEENLKDKFPIIEMPPIVVKFVAACETYIASSKNQKYMIDVMYKGAIMYYVHNMFPEAATRFRVIVDKYPRNRLAVYSANLILDSLNIEGDYAQLNEVARDYYNRKALMAGQGRMRNQFKGDLKNLIEKSQFKLCLEEGNKAKAVTDPRMREEQNALAGNCYVAFVREFSPYGKRDKEIFKLPKDIKGKHWSGSDWRKIKVRLRKKMDMKVAAMALNNSIFFYVKAGYLRKAIAVQRELLENKFYAKSNLLEETKYNLALNYQAMADYDKSSENFLEYYKKYPKGTHAKDALYNAMVFYIALGNLKTGLRLRDKYMKHPSVKADEKDQLLYGLGYIYLDNGDEKTAEKAFKDYLKKRAKDYKLPVMKKASRKSKEMILDTKGTYVKGNADRIVMSWGALIELYKRQGRTKDRFDLYSRVLKFRKIEKFEEPIKLGRKVIAEAVFYNMDQYFNEFKKLDLKCKAYWSRKRFDKCIKEKLDVKTAGMGKIEKQYQDIITELKDPYWSVAALYRIGQVYENMSRSFFESTVPNYLLDLDPMVYDVYMEKIQEKATQIEEKAVAYFEEAMSTARNYAVYNEFSRKCLKLLQSYRPRQYTANLEMFDTKTYWGEAYYVSSFIDAATSLKDIKIKRKPKPTPVQMPGDNIEDTGMADDSSVENTVLEESEPGQVMKDDKAPEAKKSKKTKKSKKSKKSKKNQTKQ